MSGALVPADVTAADAGNDPRFVVSTGRALIRPAWYGHYHRVPEFPGRQASLSEVREFQRSMVINVRRELGRVIDYLALRPDIDAEKIAVMGFSMGGVRFYPSFALEPRVDAAILVSAGLSRWPIAHPIADALHFVPRVTTPTLMLNGKHDVAFHVDTQQRAMFEMLVTPEADKRHVVYEDVGHLPIPQVEMMRETADWLDRYLGPVDK